MFNHHFRWFVIVLLFVICVINYIDRSSLSFAIPIIVDDFHFNDNQKGLLLGAFGIGYVFSSLVGGLLADHYGAKITLTVAATLWSLSTFIFGLGHHFYDLFFSRVLLGLAEGPMFPCLSRALSDWLPQNERVRALSLSLISVPISLAMSGPIVSELILMTSWRETYYILAAISLFWIPLWLYFFSNHPQESRWTSVDEKKLIHHSIARSQKAPIHFLQFLKNKTFLANNFGYFCYGFYFFFFMTWLPSYLESQYHLSLKNTAYFTIFPWLIASLFMTICGYLSDQLFLQTHCYRLSRTYIILITQICQALCILTLLVCQDNKIIVLTCICLAVAFMMAPNSIFFSVNSDIQKERSASLTGIMSLFFALSGFIAPTTTGFILNYFHSYHMVFCGLILLNISSIIIIFFFHNSIGKVTTN